MNSVTLQVPMDKATKNAATSVATEQGFSSLQEAVRIFVSKLAKRQVSISITEEPTIQLSKKNARRYDKMVEEIESGKVKPVVAHSLEEHFKQLGI